MSYADTHPVPPSPYAADDGGSVSLVIDGLYEEHEVITQHMNLDLDLAEQVEEAAQDALSSSITGLGGQDEYYAAGALEADLAGMDWEAEQPSLADGGSLPPLVLCLDTNVLLTHLDLLAHIHNLLLADAVDAAAVGGGHGRRLPLTLLVIPVVVLRELDGLKNSSRSQAFGGGTKTSRHAVGLGELARRANRWLVEAKERERRAGAGVLQGDRSDPTSDAATRHLDPSASNDDNILRCALAFRRPPSPFFPLASSPRVFLWTQDLNLTAKALLTGELETIGSGASVVPRDVKTGSLMLGLGGEAPTETPSSVPFPPLGHSARGSPTTTMEMDPGVTPVPSMSEVYTDLSSTLLAHVPPSLERHLARLSHEVLVRTGLPTDLPVSQWPLHWCFDALARIWNIEDARWSGLDLGRSTAVITSPSCPSSSLPPSPPRKNSHASRHAPLRPPLPPCRSSSSSFSATTAGALLPPSLSHVRRKLLPALAAFFAPPVAQSPAPEKRSAEWDLALEAVEVVLCGTGGRAFLRREGGEKHADEAWEDIKLAVRRARRAVVGRQGKMEEI